MIINIAKKVKTQTQRKTNINIIETDIFLRHTESAYMTTTTTKINTATTEIKHGKDSNDKSNVKKREDEKE